MENEGLYIANSIDYEYVKQKIANHKKLNSKIVNNTLNNDNENIKDYKHKVISYLLRNNGGTWERLQLNSKNGKLINDREDSKDFLNVHANSDLYPRFYSIHSAPGLLLANGNVGKHLSYSYHEINTYISKNAGYSWKKVI